MGRRHAEECGWKTGTWLAIRSKKIKATMNFPYVPMGTTKRKRW